MSAAETTAPAAAASPVKDRFSAGYRAWLLFVLLVINALNLADRQGMAATAPAIKKALGLSDTQLGLIQGLGFAIFFSLLALPIARLAERSSRSRIIAVSVAIFGAMVAACGVAQNFWHLLLARIGVGVGDAGFGPPVSSLLGDHYPFQKRASAMTVIWLGAPIGAVSGAVIGGIFAKEVGGVSHWREWFYVLGIPAIVFSLLAIFTLREPIRGMNDPAGSVSATPPSTMEVFKFLMAKRSVRHILVGGALAATAMNGLGQFFARYLVANFHMDTAQAGRTLGLIAGVSMASGLALGGFGVDWAGKFDRRWYVWGPAIGLFLAAPLFFFGAAQATVMGAIIVLLLGHIALFVYYTPTLAMAQNMVGASMRASSAFVVSLVLGLVGIGLGPTLVGFFSDTFAQQAFHLGNFAAMCPSKGMPAGSSAELVSACSTASAAGIRHSIMAMSLLFAWAALHYFLAGRRVREDLDTHYQAKPA